jgi:hypothetical protein
MKVTQYYRSEAMMYCCSQEEGSIMAGVQLGKIEGEEGSMGQTAIATAAGTPPSRTQGMEERECVIPLGFLPILTAVCRLRRRRAIVFVIVDVDMEVGFKDGQKQTPP